LAAPRLVFIFGICLLQYIKIKNPWDITQQGKMHGPEELLASYDAV
jgi:hypothetical protein